MEFWEERRKEKIEDVDEEYDDDEEGTHNSIGESLLTSFEHNSIGESLLTSFELISIRITW